jgi:plasmid stabilization system protein ParE
VRVVFSSQFKADLETEEAKYALLSESLRARLRRRIAEEVKAIIRGKGGDHVGPHGHPCRKPKPFPYYIYYSIQNETIYFLALVHQRRHPEFLKQRSR